MTEASEEATPQDDEGHAHGVEAGQRGAGGQARIERHMRGERVMGALPEVVGSLSLWTRSGGLQWVSHLAPLRRAGPEQGSG
ncbi:MAG: hypothetical protein OXU81_09200 [Gammaproteobacteria bacterium]|nr:hypothetical protein [Gammaproteobacteria bacterium]